MLSTESVLDYYDLICISTFYQSAAHCISAFNSPHSILESDLIAFPHIRLSLSARHYHTQLFQHALPSQRASLSIISPLSFLSSAISMISTSCTAYLSRGHSYLHIVVHEDSRISCHSQLNLNTCKTQRSTENADGTIVPGSGMEKKRCDYLSMDLINNHDWIYYG